MFLNVKQKVAHNRMHFMAELPMIVCSCMSGIIAKLVKSLQVIFWHEYCFIVWQTLKPKGEKNVF